MVRSWDESCLSQGVGEVLTEFKRQNSPKVLPLSHQMPPVHDTKLLPDLEREALSQVPHEGVNEKERGVKLMDPGLVHEDELLTQFDAQLLVLVVINEEHGVGDEVTRVQSKGKLLSRRKSLDQIGSDVVEDHLLDRLALCQFSQDLGEVLHTLFRLVIKVVV